MVGADHEGLDVVGSVEKRRRAVEEHWQKGVDSRSGGYFEQELRVEEEIRGRHRAHCCFADHRAAGNRRDFVAVPAAIQKGAVAERHRQNRDCD